MCCNFVLVESDVEESDALGFFESIEQEKAKAEMAKMLEKKKIYTIAPDGKLFDLYIISFLFLSINSKFNHSFNVSNERNRTSGSENLSFKIGMYIKNPSSFFSHPFREQQKKPPIDPIINFHSNENQ